MYTALTRKGSMIATKQHPPVILLLGERTGGDDPVDQWLAESRYSVFEAADPFQVLEQLSDFTMRDRPDVVSLHSQCVATDAELVHTLVTTASNEPDVPIIDFANELSSPDAGEVEEALVGLACRLDEFIPEHRAAAA